MSTQNEGTGEGGMVKRTLPEELRSVLLANALQAPDPDDTVRRVLSATTELDLPTGRQPRRRRPGTGRLLGVAAAVLVTALAGAGIVAEHQHSGRGGADQAAGPVATASSSPGSSGPRMQGRLGPNGELSGGSNAAPNATGPNAAGPNATGPSAVDPNATAPPNPPAPAGLSCAGLPGSRLDVGSSAVLSATAYVYDFRCLTADGHQSASTVAVYTGRPGALVERSVLVPAGERAQVDFVAAVDGNAVVQVLAADRSLQRLTFTGADGVLSGKDTQLLAQPCTAADLTAAIVPGASPDPGSQPYVLQLTKRTGGICVLSGYPTVSANPTVAAAGVQARQTLHGPGGGTGWPAPEIVQLARGGTVAALIEPGTGCPPSATVTVTLPGDVPLGTLRAGFSLCGAQVHPVVPNDRGSD